MSDWVSEILAKAFNEHDVNAGTDGFCDVFAQLLKSKLHQAEYVLLVHTDFKGVPEIAVDGRFYWVHAMVRFEGRYYDIEGAHDPDDVRRMYIPEFPSRLQRVTDQHFYHHTYRPMAARRREVAKNSEYRQREFWRKKWSDALKPYCIGKTVWGSLVVPVFR